MTTIYTPGAKRRPGQYEVTCADCKQVRTLVFPPVSDVCHLCGLARSSVKRAAERAQVFAEIIAASRVSATGCWLWAGPINTGKFLPGYGSFRGAGNAHRVSYETFVGPIPKGLIIRHTCDVRECVNPDHLLVGTPHDNNQDMLARSREQRGEDRVQAKLTEDAVRKIRELSAAGVSSLTLAKQPWVNGVSSRAIRKAINRVTWRWLDAQNMSA